MCYDISFHVATQKLIQAIIPEIEIDPSVEIQIPAALHLIAQSFPNYPVIVFENGKYKMKMMEWGIIAPYMNSPEKIKLQRNSMCNARAEKVLEKSSYWNKIISNRCLIPVGGFYEHRKIEGWKKKVPYYIELKSKELILLPGLFNYPQIPDSETGELTGTFTIITHPANELMSAIHNDGANSGRMPVIYHPKQSLEWLNPDLTNEEIEQFLEFIIPSKELNAIPVFTLRSAQEREDGKQKNEFYNWENLPELKF